jgi:hypothetical protein
MFEEIVEKKFRPIKSIADSLNTVSLEAIKNSDLPLFSINFLIAEQTDINERNLLNSLLEKSVKLFVNYSLRPKWTIVNYFFGGYDSKPADEILLKAEVFRFYKYYLDLISNHIKDNAMVFVTQEDVKFLIDEANKVVYDKLVNDTSSVKIKNFFSQIYKLKYGNDKEINLDWSVPFLFIKLFLEDKGFQDILDKFKIIPGLDDTMEIEMKTAIKVLTGKYYVNDDFFVLKDEPSVSKTENQKIEKGEIKTDNREQIIPEKIDKSPEVKESGKVKTEQEESNIPKEETKKITEEKKIFGDKEEIKSDEEEKPKGIIRIIKNIPAKRFHREKKNIPVEKIPEEKQKEDKQEEPIITEKPVKRERTGDEEKIKHIFKGEEIKAIQKKLFKDSKSAMYEAFDELESFNSWQDASEYLKELFAKNKVRLYNKYTVLFVDVLSDYYSKIEKGN